MEGEVSVALAVEAGGVAVEMAAPTQPWDRAQWSRAIFQSLELELLRWL